MPQRLFQLKSDNICHVCKNLWRELPPILIFSLVERNKLRMCNFCLYDLLFYQSQSKDTVVVLNDQIPIWALLGNGDSLELQDQKCCIFTCLWDREAAWERQTELTSAGMFSQCPQRMQLGCSKARSQGVDPGLLHDQQGPSDWSHPCRPGHSAAGSWSQDEVFCYWGWTSSLLGWLQ